MALLLAMPKLVKSGAGAAGRNAVLCFQRASYARGRGRGRGRDQDAGGKVTPTVDQSPTAPVSRGGNSDSGGKVTTSVAQSPTAPVSGGGKWENEVFLKKMEALRLLGFSSADASELVSSHPRLLHNNSSAAIQAHGESVKDLFLRVEPQGDVVSFILRNPRVLDSGNPAPGISLLRSIGVKDERILAFLVNKPRVIASPGLKSIADQVTSRWKKDPNSADFLRLIEVWASNNEETRMEKEEAVAGFGWTKAMFYRQVGAYPGTLAVSVDNLVQSLAFLTRCGLKHEDIVSYPGLVAGRSLEDNLKPRFSVYSFLLQKGVNLDQKPVDIFRKSHKEFVRWIARHAEEDTDFLVFAYSQYVDLKKAMKKHVKGEGKKRIIHLEESVMVKEAFKEIEVVKIKRAGKKEKEAVKEKKSGKKKEAVKEKEGGKKKAQKK